MVTQLFLHRAKKITELFINAFIEMPISRTALEVFSRGPNGRYVPRNN